LPSPTGEGVACISAVEVAVCDALSVTVSVAVNVPAVLYV
jgi:hypothetical protein